MLQRPWCHVCFCGQYFFCIFFAMFLFISHMSPHHRLQHLCCRHWPWGLLFVGALLKDQWNWDWVHVTEVSSSIIPLFVFQWEELCFVSHIQTLCSDSVYHCVRGEWLQRLKEQKAMKLMLFKGILSFSRQASNFFYPRCSPSSCQPC